MEIQIIGEVSQIGAPACDDPLCKACTTRAPEVGKWVYRFHVTVTFMGQSKTEIVYPPHHPILATEAEALTDMKACVKIIEKNAREAVKEMWDDLQAKMPMHEMSDLLKQNMPSPMDVVH